jgi:hypothetical protein
VRKVHFWKKILSLATQWRKANMPSRELNSTTFVTKLLKFEIMQKLSFSLLFVSAFLLFSDFQCPCCGPCEEVACNDYLDVRFLSKADDSDLFTNGTYQADSLRLFALHSDATTTDYSYRLYTQLYSGEAHFSFEISKDVTAYIFQFNSQERDTLVASYNSSSTECCDELTNFGFGVFRGDTITGSTSLVLKK